jgi:hypothetical protein
MLDAGYWMLVSGYWILKEFFYLPPSAGIFDQHRASSNQHRFDRNTIMLITTKDGNSFDTDTDLTAVERHILQKLFLWESMASSLQEFRDKKEAALLKGWNNSGPIRESPALKSIIRDLENKVLVRLKRISN